MTQKGIAPKEREYDKLTQRQAVALGVIMALYETQDRLPSIGEIAAALHVSKASAQQYLKALVRKRYVTHVPGKPRSTRPTAAAYAITARSAAA